MQTRADELYESWVNGNLTFVIDEIVSESTTARASLMAVLIVYQMNTAQRMVFNRMLKDRMSTT